MNDYNDLFFDENDNFVFDSSFLDSCPPPPPEEVKSSPPVARKRIPERPGKEPRVKKAKTEEVEAVKQVESNTTMSCTRKHTPANLYPFAVPIVDLILQYEQGGRLDLNELKGHLFTYLHNNMRFPNYPQSTVAGTYFEFIDHILSRYQSMRRPCIHNLARVIDHKAYRKKVVCLVLLELYESDVIIFPKPT